MLGLVGGSSCVAKAIQAEYDTGTTTYLELLTRSYRGHDGPVCPRTLTLPNPHLSLLSYKA